jgi:3-hydroxyisobutyrate dehydrogenase-like beta-hydroxyacid dehydrogenase
MKRVGLIGLGLLGSAMYDRLASAGYEVTGYDIDSAKTKAKSPENVARSTDVLLLSLPHSEAAISVIDTIEPVLSTGQLVIDTTTGDPEQAVTLGQRLGGRGIGFIDAAIAGSSQELRRGEVNVLAGGSGEAIATALPLFKTFSQTIFHMGPCGSGARMKLVSNLVLGLNRAVLAEGLAFAERLGVDASMALEVLKAGSTCSRVMDNKGPRMLARDYTPEARLSQHLKDVRLILKAAGEPLPLSAKHAELLERAEELGLGALDNSAIVEVFRAMNSAKSDDSA